MIRIVMAEDQALLASALSTLLNLEDDIEVVGVGCNGEEALDLIKLYDPDVCLLDIEMPKVSGLEVAEKVKDIRCKVIILTTFAKEGYFERAMKAKASAYILKDTPSEELIQIIRGVLKGKKVYSPELIVGFYNKEENPLTSREKEILLNIEKGYSTKDIAKNMFLSYGTVRNYISEIMDKIGSKNRIEVVNIAREKGWID